LPTGKTALLWFFEPRFARFEFVNEFEAKDSDKGFASLPNIERKD